MIGLSRAWKAFAADGGVPLIKFESGQDKDAIVAAYRARFPGHDGVVVIGAAQEKARALKARKRIDRPVQGRHFFEAVIRDNLDLGRPDRVRLLFSLHNSRSERSGREAATHGRTIV